jgi:hypothetical protein
MADLDEFAAACRDRRQRTGESQHHYLIALQHAHRVLFHLKILPEPPSRAAGPATLAGRMAGITPQSPMRLSPTSS